MVLEKRRGELPPKTSYADREYKKPSGTSSPSPSTSLGNPRTLGSMGKFFPGFKPSHIQLDGSSVVREATLNHVRGVRVIPIFQSSRGVESTGKLAPRIRKVKNGKVRDGRKSKWTK